MTPTEPAKRAARVVSVDVLRGVVIAAMIFMDHPASRKAVPWYLLDSAWHGLSFGDTVFPAFLFLVGVGMALSSSRRAEKPSAKARLRFAWRIGVLIALGLALNWYRYGEPLRILGVLQRIALASAIAYPFARLDVKKVLAGAGALLAAHTGILLLLPVPGAGMGSLTPQANAAYSIDKLVIGAGHLYHGSAFDPENLLGTLTAAALVLFGLALGRTLFAKDGPPGRMAVCAAAGAAALAVGLALSPLLPLNKHLATATFTLVTAGIDTLALVALYVVADVWGKRRYLEPVSGLGRNALAMYIGSAVFSAWLGKQVVTAAGGSASNAYVAIASGYQDALGPLTGSLAFSATFVAVFFAIASAMHHAKVYIKL